MKHYILFAAGLALVISLLSVASSAPAIAQGAIKPVQAFIVNESSTPVPVSVVPPPPQTTAVCQLRFSSIAVSSVGTGTFFNNRSLAEAIAHSVCPSGVTKLRVQKVVFTPELGLGSQNVASYRTNITVREDASSVDELYVAFLTDGAPVAEVINPFVLDTSSSAIMRLLFGATSGISGFDLQFTGTVFMIGQAIQ